MKEHISLCFIPSPHNQSQFHIFLFTHALFYLPRSFTVPPPFLFSLLLYSIYSLQPYSLSSPSICSSLPHCSVGTLPMLLLLSWFLALPLISAHAKQEISIAEKQTCQMRPRRKAWGYSSKFC